MIDHAKRDARASQIGAIATNFHEGSRSEYLAQFVFSGFGTAIPVPHQENSGIDLYCTLIERDGQRAWPRAYYSVQVKSQMTPWVFDSPESVRWIIEHPLPIFLCIVKKDAARILLYQTSPRFAAWIQQIHPKRLELIPGNASKAKTVEWADGEKFELQAPILNFTIQDVLCDDFRARVMDVLKFWIDYDEKNLFRIKSGLPRFLVPDDYETNTTTCHKWSIQGGQFRENTYLKRAQNCLEELLGILAKHSYREKDMVSAVMYAMALRQLSPENKLATIDGSNFDHHYQPLHDELNKAFGMDPPAYQFQVCDSLLVMIKEELARHGIGDSPPSSSPEVTK